VSDFEKFASSLSLLANPPVQPVASDELPDWKKHTLRFEREENEIHTKDPSTMKVENQPDSSHEPDDGYITYDPRDHRNLSFEDTHMNLHQRRLRATKKLEKW